MDESERAEEDRLAEDLKLHAARMAWRKRRQPVPSGRYSWAVWWEKTFGQGETLKEFADRMKGQKNQKG